MIWYIIKGQIFTVFLSAGSITSVTFPGKVDDYIGGKKGDFKIYRLGGGKTLVFRPLRKNIDRNFVAFVKGTKYHFNLKTRDTFHKDITIAKGRGCSDLRLLKSTPKWKLFECPRSLFFVNRTPHPVGLNETVVTDRAHISKGPPVFLDGKLIYDKGRAL